MDVERLIKLGGSALGLQGEELREWVDKQISEEKARKEEEKLSRREEAERETERLREEREKFKEQAALVTLEIELQRRREENSSVGSADYTREPSSGPVVKSPRLPVFDETKDNIDSYLLRFERYATVSRWKEEDLALYLSSLLRGKALEVYGRLSDVEARDYKVVKENLLRRYNLTDEGFNSKFRKSLPEQGERAGQFRNRLAGYLDKWIELSGKSKDSSEDLLDLVMKEQLMQVCSKDLMVFVKERKPKNSDEVVDLIEKFTEAHGSAGAFQRRAAHNEKQEKVETKREKIDKPNSPKPVCYKCNKPGHFSRDCGVKGRQVAAIGAEFHCQFCRRNGHSTEECWEKKKRERWQRDHTVAAITSQENMDGAPCKGHGHLELKCGCTVPMVSVACTGESHVHSSNMPIAKGVLNGKPVTVLRDSGCSCVVVRKGLIDNTGDKKKQVVIYMADGTAKRVQSKEAVLSCPYFSGEVSAVEMDSPLYDVILGNIAGAKCPGTVIDTEDRVETTAAVETRASKDKKVKTLLTSRAGTLDITVTELRERQSEDETLEKCRKQAHSQEIRRTGADNSSWYAYENGVLFRYYKSPKVQHGDVLRQVVVPQELRETVMKVAHESIFAGHLAAKKTTDRMLSDFYWPGIWEDVTHFCRSCDQCQRSTPKGKTAKVPLGEMPLIDEPFSRVAVDLVGPIVPSSERGYRYILTVVDYCTRYPEAVPLKTVTTEAVAEALVDIFSRTGIPREILSDRGAQFTSELMAEICRLLSIRQLTTTPYHPQCNGLVERFNGTLKGMLKKLASERPRDWDRYINAALFAYREAPQESLGFAPFELLYGRPVRGPMTILRELWTSEINDEEVKTTYQYVVDLKEKLEQVISAAQEQLKKSTGRYKKYFDRKSKPRYFQEGDKVLLLLPTKQNKLELKWQGPFTVTKRKNDDYTVDLGGTVKTFHANILKKYHSRSDAEEETHQTGLLQCAVAAVLQEDEDEKEMEAVLETPRLTQTETEEDVVISERLSSSEKQQLQGLLREFKDVLTDVPGKTTVAEHKIHLTSSTPVRKKPYPVPQAYKETLREEVDKMLEAGIIEPSESPYCSPSVVVSKKDGSNRYCVDFRALNNISTFDAEPMAQLDDLFQEIGKESKFVSKIDLTKGYWQIPLAEESKPLTAFATERGLMQFTVLPFGLQCAPAAFSRLMRKVFAGLSNVRTYIDDILIHNETWADHIACLREVLSRLKKAGLTARPSKCYMGYPEIEFLGHVIGTGKLTPAVNKVRAIKEAQPPTTKKQMRSFLGLASFYRRYVPNFAAIASPLTDCTRKGLPNKIQWTEAQDRAFNYIKQRLTEDPVLRLPDFSKDFILATDASDTGVDAVLQQEHEGQKFPVIYLSRKLLPREQRYSVVERECLAVVWAVKTLNSYLLGREFVIETDHAPLLYLNKAKSENGRLMRWALLLHQYRFRLRSVKGEENYGPDFLSRV